MPIVPVLVFFACVFSAIAVVLVALTKGLRRTAKGGEDEGIFSEAAGAAADSSLLLREEGLSTISLWGMLLERFDFVKGMRTRIAQADLAWSVGRVTLLMLLSGTVAGVVFQRIPAAPSWAVVLIAAGATFLPYGYILRRRSRRFLKMEEQFPDALDSLARALRAGHPFSAGLQLLAHESSPPLSGELRKMAGEVNLGRSWDLALENLARRVPLPEVSLFAAAVQLHGRTGGKLGEVLGNLSESMRESVALRGEVRSLAAHGKLSGTVLTVLPCGIAVMLMSVNPSYLATLFYHPVGKNLIAGAICCIVLAHFVIRKIVDIKP